LKRFGFAADDTQSDRREPSIHHILCLHHVSLPSGAFDTRIHERQTRHARHGFARGRTGVSRIYVSPLLDGRQAVKITFRGGPMDGETREIASPSPEPEWPLYWSVTADAEVETAAGQMDVAEYLNRGDGTADYVAGGLHPPSMRPGLT
jgi:hypothetical protein